MTKQNNKITWLASYPKSGNTWLRIFLQNIQSYRNTPIHINEINSTNASSRTFVDKLLGISTSDFLPSECDQFRLLAYQELCRETENEIYLKIHDAFDSKIFPINTSCFRVIYIIRNPLDVAVSFSHHSGKDFDYTIAAMNNEKKISSSTLKSINPQFRQILRSWKSHYYSWNIQSHLPKLVVKYEDMKDNPEITFGKILDFLKIPYTQEKLIQSIKFCDFDVLQNMESKKNFKERTRHNQSFFRNGKKGEGKSVLSPHQIGKIVDYNKDLMIEMEYLD